MSHKESQLTRPTLNALPTPTVWLTKPTLDEGAKLLQQLYTDSFSDFRWYQPYESVDEIFDEYSADSELLFLYKNTRPIGFVGIMYEGKEADIEPLGVIKDYVLCLLRTPRTPVGPLNPLCKLPLRGSHVFEGRRSQRFRRLRRRAFRWGQRRCSRVGAGRKRSL